MGVVLPSSTDDSIILYNKPLIEFLDEISIICPLGGLFHIVPIKEDIEDAMASAIPSARLWMCNVGSGH